MLRRAHDGAHDDNDDSVYVSKEPKVPTYVIWIAAGCVVLAVIAWSAFSAAKTRRRVRVLGKTGDDACAKAGYFRDGWILNKSGLKFQKKKGKP